MLQISTPCDSAHKTVFSMCNVLGRARAGNNTLAAVPAAAVSMCPRNAKGFELLFSSSIDSACNFARVDLTLSATHRDLTLGAAHLRPQGLDTLLTGCKNLCKNLSDCHGTHFCQGHRKYSERRAKPNKGC